MRTTTAFLSALMLILIAEEALAQRGGRGGRGREEWRNREVQFARNLEDAMGRAGGERSTDGILQPDKVEAFRWEKVYPEVAG